MPEHKKETYKEWGKTKQVQKGSAYLRLTEPISKEKCMRCNGEGKIPTSPPPGDYKECPACHGEKMVNPEVNEQWDTK
ncbi:MAG: hypothetical protein KAI71_04485 [Candidatus Pacebacteria bacterium]|nr:hypothetical protein [Candidatus Paceibacterota bacterium]